MVGEHCLMDEKEKFELWIMWRSGQYYNKELAEWFGISATTVSKIIEENRRNTFVDLNTDNNKKQKKGF